LSCDQTGCGEEPHSILTLTKGGEQQEGEENRAVLCKTHLKAATKALEGRTQLTRENAVKVPVSKYGFKMENDTVTETVDPKTGEKKAEYSGAEAQSGYAITKLSRRTKELEKLRRTGNIDRLSSSGKRKARTQRVSRLATGNPLANSKFLKAGFFPSQENWYPEHEQDMNNYVDEAIDRHTSGQSLSEGHKLVIRSLDSSGNLDTKKLRSLHRKSLRDLDKNDVRRSGPETPNVILSILGTKVPVGERQTVRPDVAEANQTPERREAVRAGVVGSQAHAAAAAGNLDRARGVRGVRRSEVVRKPGAVTTTSQGRTRDIIQLRKEKLGGQELISHEDALGHRGYAAAYKHHINNGGTHEDFLNTFDAGGTPKRKTTRIKARTETRDGKEVKVTDLPTAGPGQVSQQPVSTAGLGTDMEPRVRLDWSSLLPPSRKPETNDRRK
jgi:hypothetical protein